MSDVIAGINVSRETLERLRAFEALVLKWTVKINLIAAGTKQDLWERHVVDSAQIYPAAPARWANWADIGSGGGFPGIVVAILAKELNPEGKITLIESDMRKATFLRTAIRELQLNAVVIADRIEKAPPQNADVLSARALASLDLLLGFAERHLNHDGVALFQKGRTAQAEIDAAKQKWSFALATHPSITDADSQLLSIKELARV